MSLQNNHITFFQIKQKLNLIVPKLNTSIRNILRTFSSQTKIPFPKSIKSSIPLYKTHLIHIETHCTFEKSNETVRIHPVNVSPLITIAFPTSCNIILSCNGMFATSWFIPRNICGTGDPSRRQGTAISLAWLPKGKLSRRNSALRNTRSGARPCESAPRCLHRRDCKAAPRCTCCNNMPRLIHRRLSASSDSYWPPVQYQPCVRAYPCNCLCVLFACTYSYARSLFCAYELHARISIWLSRRRIVRMF